jgi:hypothetical protein
MRKSLLLIGVALLFATQAFASYWVVLKDGTKYEVKSKPVITNGKAVLVLVSGATLQVEANQIDAARSDEVTKLGGGSSFGTELPSAQPKQQTSSLGAAIKLRKQQQQQAAQNAPTPLPINTAAPAAPPPISGSGSLGGDVIEKFERAFENVGIFEHKVVSSGAVTLRADLTADSEEKVFNAISATSFLMTHLPGVQIETVELFMKTTTGGSSGRFQMSKADATALDTKALTREEYYVRKVIY